MFYSECLNKTKHLKRNLKRNHPKRVEKLNGRPVDVRVDHDMKRWGDKPENCELNFAGLRKLISQGDVKANIAKVRGARGREFVYKAESLAVELSGSSDDDN